MCTCRATNTSTARITDAPTAQLASASNCDVGWCDFRQCAMMPFPKRLVSRHSCARRADQPVRLLQHVVVLGLLSREKAQCHKERTEHQPDQHDFPVGAFVGAVK